MLLKSISKIRRKLNEKLKYPIWIMRNEPTLELLETQQKKAFEYNPKISVVCPLFNTPESYLRDMMNSVLNQTYSNTELCLADASTNEVLLEKVVQKYPSTHIVYKKIENNLGIAQNTNEAIASATGEYIGFIDHDDVLAPFAIFEVVKAINENRDVELIYSDEDKFTKGMFSRRSPFFKPDFSPHYLYGLNYICHFVVVKKSLLDELGGLRGEYNGSQDYDFVLRATHKAKKVIHIPQILYHWRVHKGSVSYAPSVKSYSMSAGKKALQSFFQEELHKDQVKVESISPGGRYDVSYKLQKDLVTAIIYNDNNNLLDRCVGSIEMQQYSNIEYIVVGKRPVSKYAYVESESLALFEAINKGSKYAEGKYLLFMRSSFELKHSDYIQKALTFAQLPASGAVGGKIIDSKSGKIKAMGVIIGGNGYLEFAHKGEKKSDALYFDKGILPYNVNATSFYGMLTKKEYFIELGGFSKEYLLGGSDVDYCLGLRERELLITIVPSCELCVDTSFNDFDFTNKDILKLYQKYRDSFKYDGYYSKNFTRNGKEYRI